MTRTAAGWLLRGGPFSLDASERAEEGRRALWLATRREMPAQAARQGLRSG